MGSKDKELLKKLLATFKVEAEEHVRAISSGLIELERASSPEKQMEIIERVFREAHSIKGAARIVNLVKLEATCQSLESLFAQLKAKETTLSPELLDQLHQTVDTLGALLSVDSLETTRGDDPDALRTIASSEHPDAVFPAPGPSSVQPGEIIAPPTSRVRQPFEHVPGPPRVGDQRQGLSETL